MNLSRRLLLCGGIANICIAIQHFLMPVDLVTHREFASLPMPYLQFIVLLTLAVGLCAAICGSLCLFFARSASSSERVIQAMALSQTVLWLGRLLLEFALPVKIPFSVSATQPSLSCRWRSCFARFSSHALLPHGHAKTTAPRYDPASTLIPNANP